MPGLGATGPAPGGAPDSRRHPCPEPATRRRLSEAERAQGRRRDQQRLVEATRSLLDSDGWKAWLRTRATLHGYSLHNTYLIALEARRRGFRSHPRGRLQGLEQAGPGGAQGRARAAHLRPRHRPHTRQRQRRRPRAAADVLPGGLCLGRQPDQPLPGQQPAPLAPPARQPLTGDSHAGLLQPLTELAAKLGYRVDYRPLGGPDGLCRYADRSISIEQELAANAQVATLVHELGHALLHTDPDRPSDPRVEELVVESVTYVTLAAAGLDTAGDSVPYIAGWQGTATLEALQTHRRADRPAGPPHRARRRRWSSPESRPWPWPRPPSATRSRSAPAIAVPVWPGIARAGRRRLVKASMLTTNRQQPR